MHVEVMLRNMARLHRCVNYCSFIWGGQYKKMYHYIFFLLFRLRSHLKNSCVGFHQGFQSPRNYEHSACGLVLSSVSRCLESLMKPSHSFLIYYLNVLPKINKNKVFGDFPDKKSLCRL